MLAYSLLALLLSIPLGLHAQVYSGSIVGTVTDSTGAAIPGATITVINTGTGAKTSQTAGGNGDFTFAQLPIGTYEVHVTQGNFKEFVESGVVVHTSTNTEVHAMMQIGAVTQKVTVAADEVQVQTTSASVGEVVSGTQVRELPLNGENFVGLTQLSPGVSAAQGANFVGKGLDGGVNFSVNGNPYNMNLFLVDGMNNNDVGSNRTILVYPSVDTIAEFKMIRNSYGPEYGQAAGAIISITTRSGENQFHGGLFYSGRNDALDANDWFSNHNGTGKSEERRDDYGYNISGPVVKDKLFFWWNQEWNKEIQGSSFAFCLPTAQEDLGNFAGAQTGVDSSGNPIDQCGGRIPAIPAADQAPGNSLAIANPDPAGLLIAQYYPAPNQALKGGNNYAESVPNHLNWSEWNVRGDYNVTKSNRATLRWTNDSWDNPSPNNPVPFWGESALPTVNSSWNQPSRSIMAKLSSTIGSTMVNDVEFGFGQNRIITTLGGTKASIVPALQAAYPSVWPSSLKQKDEFFGAWGGFGPYGATTYAGYWNIAPYGNHEDLYTIQDNLSKVWGNHTLKVGAIYGTNEKVESNGNGADRPTLPTGTPTIQTNNALANILLPGTGANPQIFSGITENNIDGIADVHWHDFEPYFGDTWKIRRNITLDLGFRWSFLREPYGGTSGGNTNPAFNSGGNFPNQWSNWNPKLWSAAEATANPTDACNGIMVVPGTNPCATQKAFLATLGVTLPLSNGTPGPNASLVQQNNHSVAPRFGLAWDVRGDGRTAVRIGAGQFFTREEVGLAERLANNAPFVIGATTDRSLDVPTPLTSVAVSPSANKTTGGFIPNSWQWNFSIEQELARNTTLELGYVGNEGQHLTSMYDSNFIQPANWLAAAFASGSAQNDFRPAFNFGEIGGFARGGHTTYHALQALFRAQTGSFSTFQAAYTWSHSLGNVELDNSSGSLNQQAITDQTHPGLDKGNTNINRPNIFVANEVLFLPKLTQYNRLVQETAGGWEFNSIVTAAQGSSLTIETNGGVSGAPVGGVNSNLSALVGTGYQGNQRPLVTDVGCNTGRSGDQFLNPAHFTLNGYVIGTFPGNLERRGSCFGAPNTNMDGQLAKNWYIKEKYRIKFSMDFFNLFNHANFNTANLEGSAFNPTAPVLCGDQSSPCSPSNNVITSPNDPTAANGFGQAGSVALGRQLQYTLRVSF
ncbi:MAG TPA: carboxypeptidase regulatory-like domain-containing protein [Silvibacterium sp.]|nr:carboxypeptidase regulatory-like domain-containing protein [Silvibacterium sp.]